MRATDRPERLHVHHGSHFVSRGRHALSNRELQGHNECKQTNHTDLYGITALQCAHSVACIDGTNESVFTLHLSDVRDLINIELGRHTGQSTALEGRIDRVTSC